MNIIVIGKIIKGKEVIGYRISIDKKVQDCSVRDVIAALERSDTISNATVVHTQDSSYVRLKNGVLKEILWASSNKVNTDFRIATNRYNMTVEQNIFVAKRNIVDYIWKSAKLEGLAVTYPDTEAIYNGLIVSGVSVDDILAVNNLKRAWRFVLETLNYPTDYSFICKINQYVGDSDLIYGAGFIRKMPVTIGGTSWKPDMPIESQIKEEVARIQEINNPTDRAITMMLYLMRKQMFLDGNKRTSMLAGNHIMVSNGVGILSVPIELQSKFTTLLVKYYETNNMAEIKKFVYTNCIDGLDF